MDGEKSRSLNRRTLMLIAIISAGISGLMAGAIGGAAGAIWVLETMAKPKFTPKIKNAVVRYDMPAEGARPIDIIGINKIGTPLHPCLIAFLDEQRDLLPHATWKDVRINPYFKVEGDIITEMAFAKGHIAIARGNEITIRVIGSTDSRKQVSEILTFHELVHVDQYASGRLDLPDYAASAANAYASGRKVHENWYEDEADIHAEELYRRWISSQHRRKCHPDLSEANEEEVTGRAPSETPHVTYAIFDHETQQYELVEYQFSEGYRQASLRDQKT